MVDIKKYVDILVAKGVEKKSAEDKIKLSIASIKETFGDDVSDEKIDELISLKLSENKKGERFKGVCLAFGRERDTNKKLVDSVMAEYTKDKDKAKSLGMVKEEVVTDISGATSTKLVLFDTRKFVDKAGKIENWNFGKEIKPRMTTDAMFLIDDALVMVSGNMSLEIGTEYNIVGKKNPDRINAYNVTPSRKLNSIELWDLAYNGVADDARAVDLSKIADAKPYERKITTGTIKSANFSPKMQKHIITIHSSDCPSGISGFPATNEVDDIFDTLRAGDEVIVFITTGQKKEGFNPSGTIEGIIVNPESDKNVAALGDIDIILNE